MSIPDAPLVGLEEAASAPFELYDGLLVDLDGVVYWGSRPVPHAAAALNTTHDAGTGVLFVTNNASRTPDSVAKQLRGVGLAWAAPDDVMTASQACAARMSADLSPGSKVLVVGAEGLIQAVAEVGLEPVTSAEAQPLAVVQGFGPQVGWAQLAEAAYAIRAGARFYATNLDLTLPTERGQAPGNGSLVAATRAATGVDPIATGKPSPEIYAIASARAGFRRPLAVGDRLDTDIAGARAAGLGALHVLTGVHTQADLFAARPGQRPTLLAGDLRGLLTAHTAPRPAEGGTACGEAWARWDAGWSLAGAGVDLVRAVAHECWRHLDGGEPISPAAYPSLDMAP